MQREQIATHKAFGYGNLAVLWHYLRMVAVIVGLGRVSGTALGAWLGQILSGICDKLYHLSYLKFSQQPETVLEAAVASLLAAGAGTVLAVWRAASLRPAQAMRPEPPARYRESWVEQLGPKRWLSQPTRMIIRNIQRSALKSMLTVLAIALACDIMLTGLFQRDTVSYMVNIRFGMA